MQLTSERPQTVQPPPITDAAAWSLPGAAPVYATARNPSRPSEGAQIRLVADAMGTSLIPWQQHVADVSSERRPDGSYEYQVVIVSVPRQTGKTTLIGAVGTHRCLVCGRDFFYTAQTGKDGRERWADVVKRLRAAEAFRGRLDYRTAAGSERVTFPSGAAFRCFAPTADSLHGYTPPAVCLDEAMAHDEATGELLMGAIGPAQITIRDRQLWIVSTAGTAESVFLHSWIDRAMGGMDRVALFLWAAPEGLDPDNLTPEQVAAFHPGVGFELNGKVLTPEDVIAMRASNSRAEFVRAFMNRRTMTAAYLIGPEAVRELADAEVVPPRTDNIVLTYDVAHDRRSSSVVATWRRDDGRPHSQVVLAGPGYGWLADAVEDLADSWRPAAVAADDGGHAREVTTELEGRGVPVQTLLAREFATATGSMLRRFVDGDYSHDGSKLLTDGFTGLASRPSSDGERFSRRHSVGDVSSGIAATVGAYVLDGLPNDQAAVMMWHDETG